MRVMVLSEADEIVGVVVFMESRADLRLVRDREEELRISEVRDSIERVDRVEMSWELVIRISRGGL